MRDGGEGGAALTSVGDERLGSHEHTQRAPVIGLHYKLLLLNVIAPDSASGLQNVTAKAPACAGSSQPPRRVLLAGSSNEARWLEVGY